MAVKLPIYMDNHATNPLDPRVLEAMMPYLTDVFGNAASRNHSFGFAAKGAVDTARDQVADLLGARAKEIIFTGRPFTAQEAYDWGLVNKVCEPQDLMDETLDTARRIAANAPLAVQRAKRATTVATQVDRATGYAFELEAYNRLVGTEDRMEGVRAFNEKRKPDFKGK